MKKLILTGFLFLLGCTDATWDAQVASYGESFHVECFSGGEKIFETESTGRVDGMEGGGWQFRTTDGRFVRTFADCFVWYKK